MTLPYKPVPALIFQIRRLNKFVSVEDKSMLPCAHRYLYQHGYNISMVDLVDKMASSFLKKGMSSRLKKKLDSYPTPADYTLAINKRAPYTAAC